MVRQPTVYILANKFRGTLYVGVTANPVKRGYEHKEALLGGFSSKYGCRLLVWYEQHETMESAIMREKQLKAGSRQKKIALIEKDNPYWHDLYESIAA